jgi:NADH-quinone oxidoreductase subunit J
MTGMTTLALEAGRTGTPEAVLFWILAPLSVLAALGMLFVKRAVHSALMLAFVMISLAIFYIASEAAFLGVVQIVVYTGAVMMLFLFILMLVGVDSSDSLVETLRGQRWAALFAGLALGTMFVTAISRVVLATPAEGLAGANIKGNVFGLAQMLFSRYVFAFEVVSLLLITAAMGAMVLAHRERLVPRPSQKQLSQARFRPGAALPAAGLPGPGVYARHNAVDVPALLPDGTPAEASVSKVIEARGDIKSSEQFELKEEGK